MSHDKLDRRELLKKAVASGASIGALGALGTRASAQEAAAPSVPTKTLGSTGKKIPILVMGCSQQFDPVYDTVLHRAYREGVTYLDTAQGYAGGQSHRQLAPFIEQVGRKNLWITSKVMLMGNRGTPDAYVEQLERSMPQLGTDYLDMFFMHSLRDPEKLDEPYIRMGQDLKRRGLIHHFGFSCHLGTVVELLNKAASIGSEGIDAIMFRYNFTQYGDYELNKAIDACKKAGVGLIAMKTQASVPSDKEEVQTFQSDNFSLPQAKLKAVWADERIDAAVSEMTNVQMLRENVEAAKSTVQLSMKEFQQLNQYAARTAHERCLGCNHLCESRIAGETRVADMLRYLMYDECYGHHDEARTLYRALSLAERDIDRVDLSAATAACPQGIDIPRRLAEARARLA